MPVNEERTVKVSMICCTAVVPVFVIPFVAVNVDKLTFVNAAALEIWRPTAPINVDALTVFADIVLTFRVESVSRPVDKVPALSMPAVVVPVESVAARTLNEVIVEAKSVVVLLLVVCRELIWALEI